MVPVVRDVHGVAFEHDGKLRDVSLFSHKVSAEHFKEANSEQSINAVYPVFVDSLFAWTFKSVKRMSALMKSSFSTTTSRDVLPKAFS